MGRNTSSGTKSDGGYQRISPGPVRFDIRRHVLLPSSDFIEQRKNNNNNNNNNNNSFIVPIDIYTDKPAYN